MMIKISKRTFFINALVLSLIVCGCKKEEKVVIPVLSTKEIINLSARTATTGGILISDGGANIIEKGVCWSAGQTPTISDNKTNDSIGDGNFTCLLTNLDSITTYYVRAYAINSAGTGYGNILSFKTLASPPILKTKTINKITPVSAKSGGIIISNGGASIIERGVCWSTSSTPSVYDKRAINVSGDSSFTCVLTSLTANTTYYIRAYATNTGGVGYGDVMSFSTKQENADIVYDLDGNIYNTVIIGTQTWIKENLKTTLFSDGTDIPNVTENNAWQSLTTPAYCWYKNDSASYKNAYGALYNWYIITSSKNVCPTGWHVSTRADWSTLTNFLKPEAGSKIKEAGTLHWTEPNTANNISGFSAIPCGIRGSNGAFLNKEGIFVSLHDTIDLTQFADWWVKYDLVNPEYWELRRDNNLYIDLTYKTVGLNIRCVKDY